ncbi:chorismate synthase [Campylobacter sp. CCUG 57310]|uniref:chorismate synthase n=1 Tax=Campylobacter sp. CCUG 57310 TaxID=2517362 RepID=UPI001564B008|nr:chorismate synthase [Campylobacter sp. CCUG 57310]QKF93096.1 chorismate synthase [Campylobacter sp. CCUG 57310]
MNSFGRKLILTTFGESHGAAIGGVLDGFPAGVKIDEEFLQGELDKRKPGQSKFATARKEGDKIEILSGIFEGVSTGTPIGFVIYNENQKSKDYENLREIFRPGHADYTYFKKYAIRDHRGGGRSSARETAVRVAGGAFAQILLNEFGVKVESGVSGVGTVKAQKFDFDAAGNSEIFALDKENLMMDEILKAKQAHDSVGASVMTRILNAPAGLGEGLYDKLDARLAAAMMSINGVKAVEIGEGVEASAMLGSENNDCMNEAGFLSNHAGGILGGMSTGAEILITTHFKPTPSIFLAQQTQNIHGENAICELRGRHDPCIGIRGSVVATAMARLVIADFMLLNLSVNLGNLKKIYKL